MLDGSGKHMGVLSRGGRAGQEVFGGFDWGLEGFILAGLLLPKRIAACIGQSFA